MIESCLPLLFLWSLHGSHILPSHWKEQVHAAMPYSCFRNKPLLYSPDSWGWLHWVKNHQCLTTWKWSWHIYFSPATVTYKKSEVLFWFDQKSSEIAVTDKLSWLVTSDNNSLQFMSLRYQNFKSKPYANTVFLRLSTRGLSLAEIQTNQ